MNNSTIDKATKDGWCKAKEFGCECGRDEFEPCPLPHPKDRRVVCAALRRGSVIICGPRHWDTICRGTSKSGWEQGFVDQRGVFLTREEAWKVADAAGQIIRRVGGDTMNGGHLFSENLY